MGRKRNSIRVGQVPYGRGVFAARRIRKEAVIGRVTGRVIDDPDYTSDYCIDLGGPLSLEPAAPFRYLNHCCDPNCELYILEDATEKGNGSVPQIVLAALRNIQPGVELTIDYSWPADGAVPCACQSPGCRGWIVAADELAEIPGRAASA